MPSSERVIFRMPLRPGLALWSILTFQSHMHRTFHEDSRHHNTFLFNFAYYTVIGEDCKPMEWQLADKDNRSDGTHIQLSRCSVVVALALCDDKPRRILN